MSLVGSRAASTHLDDLLAAGAALPHDVLNLLRVLLLRNFLDDLSLPRSPLRSLIFCRLILEAPQGGRMTLQERGRWPDLLRTLRGLEDFSLGSRFCRV